MFIALKTINSHLDIQDFSFQLSSLEAGLDVVSSIASKNTQLLEVILVDEGRLTQLPIEAFDEQPCSTCIQQLETQWKLLLSKPATYGLLLSDLTCQRIKLHHSNILHLEQVVYLAQQRLQRAQETIRREPHRSLALGQLERSLERCQHNLVVEQASLQRYLELVLH
jgi:hypothetical protein